MTSEVDVSVSTATMNNDTALVVNGSVDGDVIPNGTSVSMSEVTSLPAHDHVASAGMGKSMAYSLNILTLTL